MKRAGTLGEDTARAGEGEAPDEAAVPVMLYYVQLGAFADEERAMSLYEEVSGAGVDVPEDLFSVLALRGKPCAKVVQHERRGENDYLVSCESGHRYRVYVNAEGRVVVEDR